MKYLFLFLLVTIGSFAQQTAQVDFQKISATIEPISSSESVTGSMRVQFLIKQATDSVYLDAVKMRVTNKALESVNVSATSDKIWFTGAFQQGKSYTAFFEYEANPRQTLYFTGNQVWTQGQGKYTSHWLPSLDDMNDKIEFDLTVVSKFDKTVVANGALVKKDLKDLKNYWQFDMKQPMSSYLVAFAMGDFTRWEQVAASGVPIELYLSTKDTAHFEPTYRYTKEIFDFLESEIGVAYPWQNYKQVPVRDFLYAGMENTTCTIFSEAFVVDRIGFTDRNYVNVNAHELTHQWFGNLITETSGTHHWLQEGFATYYALLAERQLFGDDYYYWKLYQSAEQLKALSDEGKGESLLNPKASSLTFYEKGAWALHVLHEQIGDSAFKLAVKNYLTKHAFKNVSTTDFLTEVRAATEMDITVWEKDWLEQSAFKAEQAFNSLLKSTFIQNYFEAARYAAISLEEKKEQLSTALAINDDYIGQEVIYQLAKEPIEEALSLYKEGFASDNLYTRQAIALTVSEIPKELQSEFETLLTDASYVTQEAALYLLWANFPENRASYLDAMANTVGFQNKNIRQLWLVLALNTKGYKPLKRTDFTEELQNYTGSEYSFEIRQKAFEYCNEIGLYNDVVINNMVDAAVHHNWRFRNFARNLLNNLLKNTDVEEALYQRIDSFSTAEKEYLTRIKDKK